MMFRRRTVVKIEPYPKNILLSQQFLARLHSVRAHEIETLV